jgi:subfamily B ATP-binding cassette protein HlyB/CyaB
MFTKGDLELASSSQDKTLAAHDLIWALGSLCQLYRLPFSPELVLQQFPPPHDRTTILLAGKAFDFAIGERIIRADELTSVSFPCLAFMKNEQEPEQPSRSIAALEPVAPKVQNAQSLPLKPALLAHIDDGQLIYFVAGDQARRGMTRRAWHCT